MLHLLRRYAPVILTSVFLLLFMAGVPIEAQPLEPRSQHLISWSLWGGLGLMVLGMIMAILRLRSVAKERKGMEAQLQQLQTSRAYIDREWEEKFQAQTQVLRDKQYLLEGILRNLPGVVYRVKFDGKYTPLYVSQGASDLFNVSAENIMKQGLVIRDQIPAAYQDEVLKASRLAIEEGGLREIIFPFEVNGALKWVHNRFFYSGLVIDGYPVSDGLMIDITEQRQAEAALREREQMLSRIVNGTHEYIVFVKVDSEQHLTIESVNQAYVVGFGHLGIDLSADRIQGISVTAFMQDFLQYDQPAIDRRCQQMRRVLSSNKAVIFEETIPRPDGRQVYIESHIIPVCDEANQPTHLIYSSWDITHRKIEDDRLLAAVIETEDRERTRIAKEIHDSLGQTLTSVSMNLHMLRQQMPPAAPYAASLESALEQIRIAMDESRQIAYNLMPKAIHDFGLVLALESQLQNLRAGTETDVQFRHNLGTQRLSAQQEKSLYRIAQIALDNALKHAQATHISLQLHQHEGGLSFMIEDNGRGFDEKRALTEGATIGLNSLRTRVQALSGSLHISSQPTKGTLIHVEIPLAPEYEAHQNSPGR